MAKRNTKSNSRKTPSRSKKGSFLAGKPKFSKFALLLVGILVASFGVYSLIQTYAATQYINYYGSLTSTQKTAKYTLTTGSGNMNVKFSNNTKDVLLTIKNSKGTVLKSVKSQGKTDVAFTLAVTPDVYTFQLTTEAAFNGKKGYSVKIDYPDRSSDSVVPTTVILKPLSSETLKGTVAFSADAKDDAGVTKVEFLVNDGVIATDTTAPYSTSWNTTGISDGSHTLSVKAYDASGNIGQASASVVVNNVEDVERRFPGDPNPKVYKKAYWGAGIQGNGDPARHENPTGKSLSVRRTFWQWDAATNNSSNMYKTIEQDLANNRLPFVSIKTPGWADMASGKYDTQIDQILKKLDSYGKPIWFVVHHEPEGGAGVKTGDDPGGPTAWRGMQTRVRQRMNSVNTNNVAFMPVLMNYTWQKSSGRNPEDWWVSGVWDAYCVDTYNDSTDGSNLRQTWYDFVAWAEKKGIPYCIAEWGNRGTDTQTAQEMKDFWNWSFNNKKDMIAYTYFDSSLNSPTGSWELTGEPLNMFRDIMKNDTKVQRINDL